MWSRPRLYIKHQEITFDFCELVVPYMKNFAPKCLKNLIVALQLSNMNTNEQSAFSTFYSRFDITDHSGMSLLEAILILEPA